MQIVYNYRAFDFLRTFCSRFSSCLVFFLSLLRINVHFLVGIRLIETLAVQVAFEDVQHLASRVPK